MSALGTHEIVNLIKSSAHWETMLKVAKEIRGLSNLEAMELAKKKGLYRTRGADAGIVLEPWIVKDPDGVTVLVSFEVSRQQIKVAVESPKGKLDDVAAVVGDEIKEHFERAEGKPQPCPWSRSELRGFVTELRQLYRVIVVDGKDSRVEMTETKAGRKLSLLARRYRLTGPMQLVLTLYPSGSEVHSKRVFDPSVPDVPDGETLQTWINVSLARAAEKP
jgi:hypothetical protein